MAWSSSNMIQICFGTPELFMAYSPTYVVPGSWTSTPTSSAYSFTLWYVAGGSILTTQIHTNHYKISGKGQVWGSFTFSFISLCLGCNVSIHSSSLAPHQGQGCVNASTAFTTDNFKCQRCTTLIKLPISRYCMHSEDFYTR